MQVEGSEIKHLRKAVNANGNMFLHMCFSVQVLVQGVAFFLFTTRVL